MGDRAESLEISTYSSKSTAGLGSNLQPTSKPNGKTTTPKSTKTKSRLNSSTMTPPKRKN